MTMRHDCPRVKAMVPMAFAAGRSMPPLPIVQPCTPLTCVVPDWESVGMVLPMKATVDSVGRIVLPKPLREALGLQTGSTVDISRYGAGLQVVMAGRTAQLVERDGVLVANSDTLVDDDMMFALIDAGRR